MGTTADKIAEAILAHERSGVIDLASYREARAAADHAGFGGDRLRAFLTKGYDPAHAIFLYAQNFVSLLAENMNRMPELRKYTEIAGKAERDYMPGYPPMSPNTVSQFTMWAFFDLLFGPSQETIGTCLLRLSRDMAFPGPLVDAIRAMQDSRMGFYVHCGREGRFVRLREIGGEGIKLCHSTSGYKGRKGEIWFALLVEPANAEVNYHVCMTTPYVMVETTEMMIGAYIQREISRLMGKTLPGGLDPHIYLMKHGPSPNHWNEYIFCAYSNYRDDAIFLAGVPDIKKSLPHGRLMRKRP